MPESPLQVCDLQARVEAAVAAFLAAQRPAFGAVGPELGPVRSALEEFLLAGGKRLRPAFCYWGWRAAGGADCAEAVVAAAALELLHASALIHDDVMDGSDTRRGRPAVHRRFAALHRGEAWHGDPGSFGTSAAILLGDLCLIWSEQMLDGSGLDRDALDRARPVFAGMRVELIAGQYLDLLEQALGGASTLERALRVARYKSAKYTVEKPLHLGATLAGAPPEVLAAFTGYGIPLGEAFQLRDDVLGVFGDPGETGKPAGDDLREGKRTALIAATLSRAGDAQATLLRRHFGDPRLDADGVAQLREVIAGTGALEDVERLIAERTELAVRALAGAGLDPVAVQVLERLAVAATARVG